MQREIRFHHLAALTAALLVPSGSAGAQSASVEATRIKVSIHIDGRLDEAAWATAQKAPDLVQILPKEKEAETNPTDIRILVDDDAIYIGARMHERDPSMMRQRLARRDEQQDGDTFEAFIDSRHDHLTAYHFRVSSGGALYDGQVTSQGTSIQGDPSWDAVWEGVARVDSAGWTAELRIPFSQLPYSPGRDGEWGIELLRYSWNRQELDQYPFWSLRDADSPARYAHLRIPGELPRASRLELRPYATMRADAQRVPATNSLRDTHDYSGDAGIDARYRASSLSVLNLTVNPDFGQVEVDPAVVNLTPFETFFPEKRPFFVEGQNAFSFGQVRAYNLPLPPPTIFFSRRIGRAPQLVPTQYDFVDSRSSARILGAAKLTGRTNNGLSFGALDAYTAREEATYLQAGVRGTRVTEPATNYLVLRGTQELRKGLVRAGGFFSAVNRETSDSLAAARLRSAAYVGGIDVAADFANRVWLLDFSATGTLVKGSREAITRTQRAVTHYYQRPDHRSVLLDTTRTSLDGHLLRAAITKGSGTWLGSFAVEDWSPGLELNDLGFQLRSARHGVATDIHYFDSRRRGVMQWWTVGWMEGHVWNYDGDRLYNRHFLLSSAEFTNASHANASVELRLPVPYEFQTRGGPLTLTPTVLQVNLSYSSDRRKQYQWSPSISVTKYSKSDREAGARITLTATPSSNFKFELSPSYRVRNGISELIATRQNGPAATYGTWYDFGLIHQREVSMETRVNWTLSPRLSAQFYGQPLMSSGIHSAYLSLRRARAYDFDAYTGPPLDADFNLRSLRGNAVLRWEYSPGSTAYLVWQQERVGSQAVPEPVKIGRDSQALFDLAPHNIISVKISHWIGR